MAKTKGNKKPHHGQDAWLIHQAKVVAELQKKLQQDTQEIYACFCKVLNDEYGWTYEEITALFARTEETWNECIENDEIENMVAWCEKVTDFSAVEVNDEKTRCEGTD